MNQLELRKIASYETSGNDAESVVLGVRKRDSAAAE